MTEIRKPVSRVELDAECGTMLPAKEVVSLLDLFLNVDVALDLAAPIDLAVLLASRSITRVDEDYREVLASPVS